MSDLKTVTFDADTQQVVPKVPTEEMRRAGSSKKNYGVSSDVYASMLAAAPSPAESADHVADVRNMGDAQSAGQEAVPVGRVQVSDGSITFIPDADAWRMGDEYEVFANAAPVNGGERSDGGDSERILGKFGNFEHPATLAADAQQPCKACGGNGGDVPCAFPEGGQPACVKADAQHEWNADGERCVKCGDKDWMNTECSGKRAADAQLHADMQQAASTPHEPVGDGTGNCALCGSNDANAPIHQTGADAQQDRWEIPKYIEWMHLRVNGQWPDGVPAWARDHSGRMNDMSAAQAVIAELYSALTSPAKVGGDEREAFEAWIRSNGSPWSNSLARRNDGEYVWPNEQSAFNGWQARAALSADGGEEKRDAERYRFIRDVPHTVGVHSALTFQKNSIMDQVIDAAIAANQAKGDA